MTVETELEAPPIDFHGAFDRTAAFLTALGLVVRHDEAADGFLEGVEIVDGELRVERFDDEFAGELLHDAGHLAVLPGRFREQGNGDLRDVSKIMSDWVDRHGALLDPDDPTVRAILQAGECEAVAWSYAAALAIDIDTRIPFFRGFEGEGLALHDQVATGYYFGVHGRAAAGMTDLPRSRGTSRFPAMKRWLQI